MGAERHLVHVLEARFIFWNRLAERAKRGRQHLNAIEIGAHMIEHAIQLAPHSIYGRVRFHSRALNRSHAGADVCRVKRLGA